MVYTTGAPCHGPFVGFLVFLEELGPSVVLKSGWVMANIPIYHPHLTVTHGGGVMWGVALLVSEIYSKVKAHWTSPTTTAATSHPGEVKLDQLFISNRTIVRWPGHHSPDLKRLELVWDEMHLRANQRGQQVLGISGNAVETGGKPVQVNPRMSRGCRAAKKAKSCIPLFYLLNVFSEKLQCN